MNYLEPYNFYFELPLYSAVEIIPEKLTDFTQLVSFKSKIDGYNPLIKEQTTFKVDVYINTDSYLHTPSHYLNTTLATLTCLRSGNVFEYFFIAYKKNTSNNYFLQKIGQNPSIADLHIAQIKEYNKVLNKERLKEFTKAIGLAANGIGIGSFVYLRRIFEHLIEDAHLKAKIKLEWKEEDYQRSRMVEKISLLVDELPDFLIEHKELYGILSKGIHELEEQECLNYFLPVRTGIEMILDEKVIELEKEEKRLKASNAIKNISSKL